MRLGGLAHDGDHLGVLGDRLHERHRARRTEPAAEGDELLGVEALVAEEDDLMVEEGAADLGDRGVRQAGREVDPETTAPQAPATRATETWSYGPPAGAAGTGMRADSAVLIPTSYGRTP